MTKSDISQYRSFEQICDRLDSIIGSVRDKDTSLERSLDLFDEAIALGSAAVEMVDATELSPTEEARLSEQAAQDTSINEQSTQDSRTEDVSA